MLIWLIPLGVLLLGVGLVAWGRRGRRLDAHPICRKCGFDLVGMFVADGLADRRCPECGRDLGRRGSVRVGGRQRRPLVIAAGGLAMLLGVGLFAFATLRTVSAQQLYAWAPTWVLKAELGSIDATRTPLVAAELESRIMDGSITGDALTDLADRLLQLQTDASRDSAYWAFELGDLYLAAYSKGGASDEQIATFVRQAIVIEPSGRQRVHAGGDWLNGVVLSAPYGSRARIVFATIERDLLRLTPIDDHGRTIHAEAIEPRLGSDGPMRAVLAGAGLGSLGVTQTLDVPPGHYRVETTWRLDLHDSQHAISDPDAKPIATLTPTRELEIEVLDPGVEIVHLVPDLGVEQAVREALAAQNVRVDASGVSATIVVKEPPVGVAFSVGVRGLDGEIHPGGTLTGVPGATHSTSVWIPFDSLEDARSALGGPGQPLTLVLEATREALLASWQSDLDEAWGGRVEIVVDEVAWPDAETIAGP